MQAREDPLSEKNRAYLDLIADVYEVSAAHSSRTYIWGGLTIDIFENRFLRDHHDLDGFTLNLEDISDRLATAYAKRGYQTKFDREFLILKIEKGGVHAGFNPLEISGDVARWMHIGREGSVYFPAGWLDATPRLFYGSKVYTAGIRFEYAIRTKGGMLNPEWKPRDKDREATEYLERAIERENIRPQDIYEWIWSYNPFWYRRGYTEFFRPTVAWPLSPK